MHTREKVSVTGKETIKYAPHSSHTQSVPNRIANMKEKEGRKDKWTKDREEKHTGSEVDGAAQPTASLRKLRCKTRWIIQSIRS